MRYLTVRRPEGRPGVLTDRKRWDFMYIKRSDNQVKLYQATRIVLETREDVETVLGYTFYTFHFND
jgi:hypothetical protein